MSTIQLDFATVMSILALATGIIAIINFALGRKRVAMEDGKRQETAEQLRRDLDRAHEKIRVLETCTQQSSGDMREVMVELKWIRAAIEKIDSRLTRSESDMK